MYLSNTVAVFLKMPAFFLLKPTTVTKYLIPFYVVKIKSAWNVNCFYTKLNSKILRENKTRLKRISAMSNKPKKNLKEQIRPAENTLLPIIKENTSVKTNSSMKEKSENNEKLIPIIEEIAFIDKKIVETGKVLISKRITEHEEIVDEPLLHEEVSVERVAVNQFVDERPQISQQGDTMIIPVIEERIVTSKRLFLVEELHVKKQVIESHQPQRITLLKEEVDVKRTS